MFHADGRTDRQTDRQTDMTKLTVTFRSFANAPKKTPDLIAIFCMLVAWKDVKYQVWKATNI
jgi:hypothetical protein